jgi:anti-anti-sigma regulatory factor
MSDFRVSESGKDGELILAGSLTIENASAIRKKLVGTLMSKDAVVVSIDSDAPADISFLQILCSAHQTASTLGKSFSLSYMAAGNFVETVENSGYLRRRGCSKDRGGTCLWVRGGNE